MGNNDGVEAQTVVDTVEQSQCGSHTDVRYQQRFIGDDVLGYAPCAVRRPNGNCDMRDVRIAWGEIRRLAVNDNFEARHTLCHEVGHTLGVRHYSGTTNSPDPDGFGWYLNSCMISGIADSGSPWTRQYGEHHRAHINGAF